MYDGLTAKHDSLSHRTSADHRGEAWEDRLTYDKQHIYTGILMTIPYHTDPDSRGRENL